MLGLYCRICLLLAGHLEQIGQATSTRVDVLPEPYVQELQKLQDKVAVFSSIEARQMIEEGVCNAIGMGCRTMQ